MNLITSCWIPIRTLGDERRWIAPWQITEGLGHDPIVAIDAPRADFTGALMQFLIGLLQTTFAPEDVGEWERSFRNPPAPEQLQEALAVFEEYFHFGPERPSFMEDLELDNLPDSTIGELLINAPGENTRKHNKDFFVKRSAVQRICPEAAAMALLARQINTGGGGQSYRTSIRGGGPLSTLLINEPETASDTLWHNTWLNVLPKPKFERLSGDPSLSQPGCSFPWMAPTRISDKSGVSTTPEDAHPLMLYWAMPWRIRLNWSNTVSGICDLTGRESDYLLHVFQKTNQGFDYQGSWLHPLSPYQENKNGSVTALHPQPGGIFYRHWLGLTTGHGSNSRPAAVIDAWRNDYRRIEELRNRTLRIWAFGYDLKNAKARCWYESLMPLHYVASDAERFQHRVGALIEAAELAGTYVSDALMGAWLSAQTLQQLQKSKSSAEKVRDRKRSVKEAFWQATEPAFYDRLAALAQTIDTIEDEDELDVALHGIAEAWLETLQWAARQLFNQWAANGYFDAENPARISVAHNDLEKKLNGGKLRDALGLPKKRKAA